MIENIKNLRLGNWIKATPMNKIDDFYLYAQVTINILSGIHSDKEKTNEWNYITLTRKLLENFYFRSLDSDKYNLFLEKQKYAVIPFHSFHVYDGVSDESCEEKVYCLYMGDAWIKNIKYLHELQNLIYDITEIELNDIVAYNYYMEIMSKSFKQNSIHPYTFEEFLSVETSCVSTKFSEYKLRDLPPNLFS